MAKSPSVTPFIAETTTATPQVFADSRTKPAAWSMRSAPKSELPPNLKARTSRAGAREVAAQAEAIAPAGLSSSGTSCCTSGLMTAPISIADFSGRLFASLEGLKEETHRQVRFRRWVGNLV